jgi:hypothetical protein
MKLNRLSALAVGLFALTTVGTVAWAVQEGAAPQMAQPSAEHKLLLEGVGTWDCALQLWMAPGEPEKMTGVETSRALGPFHVLSEFKADMMGMPFEGHGVLSWDPAKKKFFSLWVDSTEPSPATMEGTYDAKTRTLTFTGRNTMMGELQAMREVVTLKDADHSTFEMFVTGADGKEKKTMQIDYTRKK